MSIFPRCSTISFLNDWTSFCSSSLTFLVSCCCSRYCACMRLVSSLYTFPVEIVLVCIVAHTLTHGDGGLFCRVCGVHIHHTNILFHEDCPGIFDFFFSHYELGSSYKPCFKPCFKPKGELPPFYFSNQNLVRKITNQVWDEIMVRKLQTMFQTKFWF